MTITIYYQENGQDIGKPQVVNSIVDLNYELRNFERSKAENKFMKNWELRLVWDCSTR
jgi:hypothetical protein